MLFKIHVSLVRPFKRFPRFSHCESRITSTSTLRQLNMSIMKKLRECANGGGFGFPAPGSGLSLCLVERYHSPFPCLMCVRQRTQSC